MHTFASDYPFGTSKVQHSKNQGDRGTGTRRQARAGPLSVSPTHSPYERSSIRARTSKSFLRCTALFSWLAWFLQAMRTTTAKRREIEVATAVADTMLQMRALGLCSAVSPGRASRIGEKTLELAAMTT